MVYAKFRPGLSNLTTNPVTQWDYGRKLRIDGLELPTAVRIDFGIDGASTTISRIGTTTDNVTDVVIPDSLLEQSNRLVAYVYIDDTTHGETVRAIYIPVTARAMPEEFDTPEAAELFAEAIALINDVAERAEGAASEAASSADSASASLQATQQIANTFSDTAETATQGVNSAGATQIQAIGQAGAQAVSEVETAGENVVADVEAITDEIIADREQIDSNTRHKAGAIVLDVEGESIVVNDASEYPMIGLTVYGKSTQDGTPTPDAPIDIVSVENPIVTVSGGDSEAQTITLPHTLHGIPVEGGGNYTDANGQQWICDEVDLKRGVYVRRVKHIDLKTTDNWHTWGANYATDGIIGFFKYDSSIINGVNDVVCSVCQYSTQSYIGTGVGSEAVHYGNPFYIISLPNSVLSDVSTNETAVESLMNFFAENNAELLIPRTTVETPLTAEEIAAFKALHSNKPNTTIMNDAGAYMAVSYVADTKTYIDNKIAEMLGGE